MRRACMPRSRTLARAAGPVVYTFGGQFDMRFLDPATSKTRGTHRRLMHYRPGQSMIVCITNRSENAKERKLFNPAKMLHWKLAIVEAQTLLVEWDFSGAVPLPASGNVRRIHKVQPYCID
jgi:hypothetical protein